MKSLFLTVAIVLGAATSISVRAAEPEVLRVVVVQPNDVAAYAHEIELLRSLYKKQALDVEVVAYQVTYAGPGVELVLVEIRGKNLAAIAKMDAMTRTQPDIAAETKTIAGMQKLIFIGLYDKQTPGDVINAPPPLSTYPGEPPVLRGIVVQTPNLPAYVREIGVLQALYKKHGMEVTIEVFHGTYAGSFTGNIDVQVRMKNLTEVAKMDEMGRTQPDVAAQIKKIGKMEKILISALYDQITE